MNSIERQAWLAERRKGIGSSDAAAACGLRPGPGVHGVYQTALGLYLDKKGLVPPTDSQPMRWGRRLEAVVADAFDEETGLAIEVAPALVQHPRIEYMRANPDYLIPGLGPLEVKTARSATGWGPSGTDQVPEGYVLQVMHQLEVLGADVGYVAVLIGGQDFRWYTLPRNGELIDRMLALEAEFWRRVEDDDPPEPDWEHPDTPGLVRLLCRPLAGTTVELDAFALALAQDYQSLGPQVRAMEKHRERVKGELIAILGTAETGLLPDGRRVTRKITPRKGYTVEPGEADTFRITGRATETSQPEDY